MAEPVKRHYRERPPAAADDEKETRSSSDRPGPRDEPRSDRAIDRERSPPRDSRGRDDRDSRDRSERRDRDSRDDRSRGYDRSRYDGDRDKGSDRRDVYARGGREPERRSSGVDRRYDSRRSASPPPRRDEKIGDFKSWVPSVGERRSRPDDAGDEPLPEVYSVLRGTVASVQSFGAFIKFEGRKRQGLVHVSQLSNYRVEDPRSMLDEGESVWVKVIAVTDDDGGKKKISLSMKLVNQTTGADLDANNVALTMSQRKRGSGASDRGPVELGYALPTVCTKCGGAGHLATECKVTTSGAHYALLPEPGPEAREPEKHHHHHHHHHHKEKKEKKEKKHKHKKHRKEKKEKKHKKKHSSDSSSRSSSDSD